MDAEIRFRIVVESVLVSVCVFLFSTMWNTQVEEDDLCFSACSARYLQLLSSQHPVNYSFKLWRCSWNIHDRIHYGSWMKIQFHDAVIYNIFLFPRFIASSSSPRSAKSWSLQMLLCIQSVELWLIIVAVILSNKH